MSKWFVFARASSWGWGFVDLSYRSMSGNGRTFGGLERLPPWLYYV